MWLCTVLGVWDSEGNKPVSTPMQFTSVWEAGKEASPTHRVFLSFPSWVLNLPRATRGPDT